MFTQAAHKSCSKSCDVVFVMRISLYLRLGGQVQTRLDIKLIYWETLEDEILFSHTCPSLLTLCSSENGELQLFFHGFNVHESDLLAQSSRTGEICNLTLCQKAFCFMLKPEKNGWKSCSSGILQSENYLSVDKFIFRKPEVNNWGLFGIFCLFILVLHLSLNNIM